MGSLWDDMMSDHADRLRGDRTTDPVVGVPDPVIAKVPESLVDSARCVVATVFGNTDDMSLELHLEAIRAATQDLRAELEAFDREDSR